MEIFLYKLKVRLPRCASFNFSPHIRKMKILGKRLIFFQLSIHSTVATTAQMHTYSRTKNLSSFFRTMITDLICIYGLMIILTYTLM